MVLTHVRLGLGLLTTQILRLDGETQCIDSRSSQIVCIQQIKGNERCQERFQLQSSGLVQIYCQHFLSSQSTFQFSNLKQGRRTNINPKTCQKLILNIYLMYCIQSTWMKNNGAPQQGFHKSFLYPVTTNTNNSPNRRLDSFIRVGDEGELNIRHTLSLVIRQFQFSNYFIRISKKFSY